MSDARLRELERQWKETADPGAGAIYLRARVRAGTLTADALELAAYLGDSAARAALEAPTLEEPPPLTEWVKGLNRWGKPASVRAAIAVAEATQKRSRHAPNIEQAVRRAQAWLDDPTRPLPEVRGGGSTVSLLDNVLAARGTFTAGIRAAALAEHWYRVIEDEAVVRSAIQLDLVTWLYGSAPPIEVDDWAEVQVQASVEQREQDIQASQALLSRVGDGSLRRDQLELLAHLNHRPARLALNLPGTSDSPYDLDHWLNAIGRYGVEPLCRAAEALRGLPWHHERRIRWREGSRSWARSLIKQLDTQRAEPSVVRSRVREVLVVWILGSGAHVPDVDLR